ncbi:MAG: zf-HC2 domain-containing protein [Gemmatimonadota bacterium]
MNCEAFLDLYTEYRDGLLDELRLAKAERHLATCESCTRYDSVFCRGIELLHTIPSAESAEDFMPRLRHRLYNVDDGIYRASRRQLGGSAALIGVASVGLLSLLWLPFATRTSVEFQLQAVAAERVDESASPEVPALFLSEPIVATVGSQDRSDLDAELTEWPPRKHVHPTILLGSRNAQLFAAAVD